MDFVTEPDRFLVLNLTAMVPVSPGSYRFFDSAGTVHPQVDFILPIIKRAEPVLVKLNWQVLPFSPGLTWPKSWTVFSKEIRGVA